MSNETMPEKIWADKFGTWMKIEHHETASYTRDDTIPARAEVAREYLDTCEAKLGKIINNTIPRDPNRNPLQQAREDVLKEWEETDKCR